MTTDSLNIDNWSKKLGLFPMPLFQDKFLTQKFILLNGGRAGNLCLDFNIEDYDNIRSYAWSSDVGQYISIKDESVNVYRWDSFDNEKYSLKSVENKLDSFYLYLKKQNINSQESIVKFIIIFYRQIRTILRDNNGNDSLNVLMLFFACVSEQNLDIGALDMAKWHLSPLTKDKSQTIDKFQWEELYTTLTNGLKNKNLRPDISLLLRHASGAVFQEAHFETLFTLQYQTTLGFALPEIDKGLSKKNIGQTTAHFTPTSIVRAIVEESLKNFNFNEKKQITVLDPACGSGEFLKEFLRQIRLRNYVGKIRVIGWDISSSAIDMANFIVNYEVQAYANLVSIQLELKDALINENWNETVDFIFMNPPFISWELMSNVQRDSVSTMLGGLANNKPNSASAFLWKAVTSLNAHAIIGCVLPTSIFENDSYISLRNAIKETVDIELLGRLGSHTLFSDAVVDAGLFIAQKDKVENPNPLILWSDYKSESSSNVLRELRKLEPSDQMHYVSNESYSIYQDTSFLNSGDWRPVPFKSFELLNRFKDFTKVEDIFDVRQGARTGLNSAFVVPKEFYNSLGFKEKKFFRPAVTNESISAGVLIDNYYLFYPSSEDLPETITEGDLEQLLPIFYKQYLQPNYSKLISRKGIKEWWTLTRPRNWQKEFVSKIVSTEFGKAGAFAFDKTGTFVAERSHAWFPKGKIALGEIGYAYVSILNMPIINHFLSGLSKQIGGGQWYLSSKYINKMPMPNLFTNTAHESELVSELIEMGIQISNGKVVDKERLIDLSIQIFYA